MLVLPVSKSSLRASPARFPWIHEEERGRGGVLDYSGLLLPRCRCLSVCLSVWDMGASCEGARACVYVLIRFRSMTRARAAHGGRRHEISFAPTEPNFALLWKDSKEEGRSELLTENRQPGLLQKIRANR